MYRNHYNTRQIAIKALNRRQSHQVLHALRGMRAHSPRRRERQDEERYQRDGIEVGLKKWSWVSSHREIWSKGGKNTLAKSKDGKVQDQEEWVAHLGCSAACSERALRNMAQQVGWDPCWGGMEQETGGERPDERCLQPPRWGMRGWWQWKWREGMDVWTEMPTCLQISLTNSP